MPCVLAIDEGTTGVRAMLFDERSVLVGAAYEEVGAAFPRPGWMEQDPLAIWAATQRVIGAALRAAGRRPSDVAAIGVATQRATTVVWDRDSGRPIYLAGYPHRGARRRAAGAGRVHQQHGVRNQARMDLARAGRPPPRRA
jgi:glycerol kinase